jgi:hypothetical protein
MRDAFDLLTFRMAWCREQMALAETEFESDAWRAEEEGLRDALLNKDHTEQYRLSPPEILERYLRGFHDGMILLRAARADRMIHPAAAHDEQWSPSASTGP